MSTQSQMEALVASFTLQDLAKQTDRSIEEIVEFAMNGPRRADSPRRAPAVTHKAVAPKSTTKSGAVDTRKPASRAAYQQEVLKALQEAGDWAAAPDLRKKVGGTPAQIRAALNSIIEQGDAQFKGEARGTRYLAS